MIVMTEQPEAPAEERRGGQAPDWDQARPGEELPDPDPPEDPRFSHDDDCDVRDRDVAPLGAWCGNPRCGGD
jgi:hypothetical protein